MATTLERVFQRRKTFLQREFPGGHDARVVTIYPADAEELLTSNDRNRTASTRTVDLYTADMAAGRWTLNGDTIKISDDGWLNDGQHRLMACVKSGRPFTTFVVYGVARDSRLTVDQGRIRNAGCYLAMGGTVNAKALAAIARLAIIYQRTGGRAVETNRGPTNSEVMAFVAEHHDALQDAFHIAQVNRRLAERVASQTLFGFWGFILRGYGEKARQYIHQVQTGENVGLNDPAYRVRERLIGLSRSARASKTEAFLRGWHNYKAGKPMTLVKVFGGELPSL